MSIPLKRSTDLCLVLDTPRGRGIFASAPIPAGTVIETCPILLLEPGESVPGRTIFHYTYNWPTPDRGTQQAIILGLGSMFNHSLLGQNVGWKRDVEAGLMVYSTLRDIREGEELFITYGANLTFEDVEKKMMEEEAKKEDTTEEVWGRMDVEGLL